jgi:hypothetical protein
VSLGLTEKEFWSLTPAQFFSMCKVKDEEEKMLDFRTGLVTTVIRRIVGDKKAEPFDLFENRRQKKQPKQAASASELRAGFNALVQSKKGKP